MAALLDPPASGPYTLRHRSARQETSSSEVETPNQTPLLGPQIDDVDPPPPEPSAAQSKKGKSWLSGSTWRPSSARSNKSGDTTPTSESELAYGSGASTPTSITGTSGKKGSKADRKSRMKSPLLETLKLADLREQISKGVEIKCVSRHASRTD